ncbi:isocitrate lyase/phosphoenolpyruvate mutase family protein [Plantactinospora sp. B6F1]|uniref:isocitrate lyase/phosphoenolpyruvate mutase family protein n=1 Tax=Plantactinospora sp. B6F1 TaxID=3158971 RepID=UPI0032D997CD
MKTRNARGLLGPRALWIGVYDGFSAKLVARSWLAGTLPAESALWVSSFCVSASLRACPDASIVSSTEMIAVGRYVETAAGGMPVVLDCDCGYGDADVFRHVIEEICRTSRIAAVCFEDKVFPKRNSFYGRDEQHLERLDVCVEKIRAAAESRTRHRDNLAIVARTEALVAGQGVDAALERLDAFASAGADALMVQATGPIDELDEVCRRWCAVSDVPLVAAPTMYPNHSPEHFWSNGFAVYIYANQLLRAAGYAADATLHSLADALSPPAAQADGMWSVTDLNDLVGASPEQRRETLHKRRLEAVVGAGMAAGTPPPE